jgi:hypothetical protein
MSAPSAPAPAPEPSDKISGAKSISDIIDNLFRVAEPHLSRNDFETLSNASELGILSLQNTQSAIETIGCDLDSEKPRRLMCLQDRGNLRAMLFHIAESIDLALALINTGSEADYWIHHYDERRALCAKEEEA